MEPPLFLTGAKVCRRTGRAAGVEEETAAGATEDGTTRPEASHQGRLKLPRIILCHQNGLIEQQERWVF
ncbi:unnamed protein product [Lampetra fluviatilis]